VDITVVPAGTTTFASGAAAITTTAPGPVTIAEAPVVSAPPAGFALLGVQFNIQAPDATVANPLQLAFTLDSSVLDGANENTVGVLRNGVAIPACSATDGSATPDPCVTERNSLPGGDVEIVVLSSHASRWNFAVPLQGSRPGRGCGDRNHVHDRDASCKKLK
jgi:hypothetical protein